PTMNGEPVSWSASQPSVTRSIQRATLRKKPDAQSHRYVGTCNTSTTARLLPTPLAGMTLTGSKLQVARGGQAGERGGSADGAHGVDGDERADGRRAHAHARRADAAAHRAREHVELAHGRAGARAHVAFRHDATDGGLGRRVSHLARRTHAAVADREIEEE